MENKKKIWTKSKVVALVVIITLSVIYSTISYLSLFEIIPNLQWLASLILSVAWILIGISNNAHGQKKWYSIFCYILALLYVGRAVIEFLQLYF